MPEALTVVSLSLMLASGTASTVLMKLLLQIRAKGWLGYEHDFDKPFMQAFAMFVAMAISYFLEKVWNPQKSGREQPVQSTLRDKVLIGIPASFDLVASILMTFGLIWVNASVMQLLRGSMVIWSTLLCFVFLHKRYRAHEWIGVLGAVVAIVLVGVAGSKIGNSSSDHQYSTGKRIVGALLILAAQLVQAAQLVVEQVLLRDLSLPALAVVGWEGIWGVCEMIVVVFPFALIVPGSDKGPLGSSLENFMDSFIQVFTNGKVAGGVVGFMVAVLGLNIFGMLVTLQLGAVNRTLMEAARTAFVWIVVLICGAAGSDFGEPWTRWSWLELAGFVLLFTSTAVYNGLIRFPGCNYDQPGDQRERLLDPGEAQ